MLGDVIVAIGGDPIKDQIGFAKKLYALKPGDTVEFRMRRGTGEIRANIILGLSPSPAEPGG